MTLIKKPLLEIDFINDIYVVGDSDTPRASNFNKELKKRFLEKLVDPFWHNEKDKLDYLVFYNTGEYFCQRTKLKYDFTQNTSFWSAYTFYEATQEQADKLKQQIEILLSIASEIKVNRVFESIQEIDKEVLFFDRRYSKKLLEKNNMLNASDWRVLPDIIDSYPGEKDMWIKWRNVLRKEIIRKPDEFETPLEFLKYIYAVEYPIDPTYYRKKYPEGEVEYLSTEDQWVDNDIESSSDFVDSKLLSVMNLNAQYKESYRRVKKNVMEVMKLLEVDNMSNIKFDEYVEED